MLCRRTLDFINRREDDVVAFLQRVAGREPEVTPRAYVIGEEPKVAVHPNELYDAGRGGLCGTCRLQVGYAGWLVGGVDRSASPLSVAVGTRAIGGYGAGPGVDGSCWNPGRLPRDVGWAALKVQSVGCCECLGQRLLDARLSASASIMGSAAQQVDRESSLANLQRQRPSSVGRPSGTAAMNAA
jgi:hypothetical protein